MSKDEARESANEKSKERRKDLAVKEKMYIYVKEWRINNPEKYSAQRVRYHNTAIENWKKWDKLHPGAAKEASRLFAKLNPDKILTYNRAYVNSHRPHLRLKYSSRRAKKAFASVAWAALDKMKKVYAESERVSKESGTPYEVDHIVPLVSDLVCGLHWEGNLQIITREQNRKKSNLYWPGHPDENYDKLVP
jgi:hypothetical protein